jgi:hypothetical protein
MYLCGKMGNDLKLKMGVDYEDFIDGFTAAVYDFF